MSGLFLNFYQVEIPLVSSIKIGTLPYSKFPTKEGYKKLREDFPEVTFYRYDDLILLIPRKEGPAVPENVLYRSYDLKDHPKILAKIFEQGIVDFFRARPNGLVFKNSHSNSWDIVSSKDLLESRINGLCIYRVVHFSTNYFFKEGNLFFGFTLSTSLKNTFTWTKTNFVEAGIDVKGLRGKDEKIYADLVSLKRFLESRGVAATYDAHIRKENLNSKAFEVIDGLFKWLNKKRSEIILPFNLSVSNLTKQYLPFENDTIKSEIIRKPQRYFYSNRKDTQRLRYYDEMVKAYQPYSLELYKNKSIHIGVICPREYQGETEGFIKKIEAKLKEAFHFSSLEFHLQTIKNTELESYKDVLYDEQLLKCSLIYIIVNKAQEKLLPQLSPYYVCKAKLIGNGIPTQDIQIETIRRNLTAPTMTNIALNTYAKLGGTAWTIEKEDKLKEELVIGIGSTISATGQHVLGIAQVFHNDGRYMTGDCSPLSTFSNYTENLEKHLYKTLLPLINEMSKNGTFRLIFHLFKSASEEYEIEAINRLRARFADYQFEFALIHLGYGHNYRLYLNEGKDNIQQGTYVQLSAQTAILHFVNKSDLPLKIDLDKRSTFNSLFYIAKQVYWFSHLSHRSYMPSKRTVTIMYPSLMAKITEELKKVEGWDFDRLKAVSDKLWFI